MVYSYITFYIFSLFHVYALNLISENCLSTLLKTFAVNYISYKLPSFRLRHYKVLTEVNEGIICYIIKRVYAIRFPVNMIFRQCILLKQNTASKNEICIMYLFAIFFKRNRLFFYHFPLKLTCIKFFYWNYNQKHYIRNREFKKMYHVYVFMYLSM